MSPNPQHPLTARTMTGALRRSRGAWDGGLRLALRRFFLERLPVVRFDPERKALLLDG